MIWRGFGRGRNLCSRPPGRLVGVLGTLLLFGGACRADTPPQRDLTRWVNPMAGTGVSIHRESGVSGSTNAFPGAMAPFGMIQWSPDTGDGLHRGGYDVTDRTISGFSLTHWSGVGCVYGGDFSFMPLDFDPVEAPRGRGVFGTPFSHDGEVARPGSYDVTLGNGIRVELTTTTRCGMMRCTFPRSSATFAIDAASEVRGVVDSSVTLDPAHGVIQGRAIGGNFCGHQENRTLYVRIQFDRPFSRWSTWSGEQLDLGQIDGAGRSCGTYVTFDLRDDRQVTAQVGLSYVSAEGARRNLEQELGGASSDGLGFDAIRDTASASWNEWLHRIQIEGASAAELRTFYTMMYHALLGPCVVSDVDGRYMGYDGRVHATEGGREQYGVFSGWDIYRSQCQLIAMIAPREASAMAQSLLEDYRQGGAFPRWGGITMDTGIMMGDPAAPMIAAYHAFGARDFEARAALDGLVRAATDPSVEAPRSATRERDALEDYLELGYVPQGQNGGYGPVSMTLEYAVADFAVAQLADRLNEPRTRDRLLRQAQNWHHVFNPESGYVQLRRRDGSWAPGFVNHDLRYDGTLAFVEGTAGQYTWMVPFDPRGLAEAMGGVEVALERLDKFFGKLVAGERGPDAWMASMANEPSMATPWIYCFLGRPDRTQALVRRVVTELYSAGSGACPGNDDLGTLSSWYIFAALGFYPAIPGSDVLVLHGPMYPRASIALSGGTLEILGHGASRSAPFIQRVYVNGQPWDRTWLRYSDLAGGGRLEYDLGLEPSSTWGRGRAAEAPSLSRDGLD